MGGLLIVVGLNNMFSLSTIYFKIVSNLFSLEKCKELITNKTYQQIYKPYLFLSYYFLVPFYGTMEGQGSMRFLFLPQVKNYKLNVLKEKKETAIILSCIKILGRGWHTASKET